MLEIAAQAHLRNNARNCCASMPSKPPGPLHHCASLPPKITPQACLRGHCGLEVTVRKHCSKSHFEITIGSRNSKLRCEVTVRNHWEMYDSTLFHWTLLHFAPCMDMHGFTLVYIYIYIYIYIFFFQTKNKTCMHFRKRIRPLRILKLLVLVMSVII